MKGTPLRRTRRRKEEPDAVLHERIKTNLARVGEVEAKRKTRSATTDDYNAGIEAFKSVRKDRHEIARRTRERTTTHLAARYSRRSSRLEYAVELDRDILQGVVLNASLLTDDDMEELGALLRKRRDNTLTRGERRRYEALLGKAANEPALFERKRREAETERKAAALARSIEIAAMPRRAKLAGPGDVQLPRHLFDTVLDGIDETLSIHDIALLAMLIHAFETKSGSMFARGSFADGTILITDAGHSVTLAAGIDPEQRAPLRRSLTVLHINDWIQRTTEGSIMRITQSPQMRALLR